MKNIYTDLDLPAVINASGRMTKLGVSTVSDHVGTVMAEAAGNYVVTEDLFRAAGKKTDR